jgi:hypothetical protein
MQDSLTIEVQGYLRRKAEGLREEMTAKGKKYNKTLKGLRRLPFASPLEKLFGPFLARLLPRRLKKIRRDIVALKEKLGRYEKAIGELEQGEYDLAIELLDKLADEFFNSAPPLAFSGPDSSTISVASLPGSMFLHVLDLKKQLSDRLEEKVA